MTEDYIYKLKQILLGFKDDEMSPIYLGGFGLDTVQNHYNKFKQIISYLHPEEPICPIEEFVDKLFSLMRAYQYTTSDKIEHDWDIWLDERGLALH